jgi:hypothetical protein
MFRGSTMLWTNGRNHRQRGRHLLVVEVDLFTLGTITLWEPKVFSATIFGVKVGTEDFMFNFPHSKREISLDITLAHIKVQKLRLHDGHCLRITKYDYSIWGLLKIFIWLSLIWNWLN